MNLATPKHALTAEQEAIVNSRAKILVVKAFSGSGKTSTCFEYARRRPKSRILSLAFNKAIAKEAKEKFKVLGNVTCNTTHGFAYQVMLNRYGPAKLGHDLSPHDISKLMNVSPVHASKVLSIIESYACSGDDTISDKHIDKSIMSDPEGWPIYIKQANSLWKVITSPTDNRAKIPHDVYLKLYQLERPDLSKQFDIVILDEAQDSSGCVVELLRNQKLVKVIVGDNHQSIYGWRGAINAMEQIIPEEELSLTKSFRFGPYVADAATKLLQHFKGERQSIIGSGSTQVMSTTIDTSRQFAYIARTNGELFDTAVSYLDKASFGFVGGVESYQFHRLIDIYNLINGVNAKYSDVFWNNFESREQLITYAEKTSSSEIKSLIKIVDKYGNELPRLVNEVRVAGDRFPLAEVQVVLTNVHRSKGLEFSQVALANDFADLLSPVFQNSKNRSEEINLLYVATTRAMDAISLNNRFADWLARYDKYSLAASNESGQKYQEDITNSVPEVMVNQTTNNSENANFADAPVKSDAIEETVGGSQDSSENESLQNAPQLIFSWVEENIEKAMAAAWGHKTTHRIRDIVAWMETQSDAPEGITEKLISSVLADKGYREPVDQNNNVVHSEKQEITPATAQHADAAQTQTVEVAAERPSAPNEENDRKARARLIMGFIPPPLFFALIGDEKKATELLTENVVQSSGMEIPVSYDEVYSCIQSIKRYYDDYDEKSVITALTVAGDKRRSNEVAVSNPDPVGAPQGSTGVSIDMLPHLVRVLMFVKATGNQSAKSIVANLGLTVSDAEYAIATLKASKLI